nr:vacuolar-processing enzyme-like [Tanacetum cinerariifolium]
DYTGANLTTANFYAVLLGNAKAVKGGSGKVVASKPNDKIFVYYSDHGAPGILASKPNDKIFVYYSDHGAPGILGMPSSPYIIADEFIEVLKKKHVSGTYDEMVIYLESCESGCMFEGLLPDNMNIYVTTASNATEDSWATYCSDTKPPSPPGFDTCLGDLYSISWMEDSDKNDLRHETLEQQYLKVKKRTRNTDYNEGSHVMQYGTLRISNETVSVYQGSTTKHSSMDPFESFDSMGVVNQRDADLYSMRQRYKRSTGTQQQKDELLQKIKEITAHRAHLDSSVHIIKQNLLGNGDGSVRAQGSALVDDWGCLKFMIRTFETYCGTLTQYGMKHTRTFANICNNGVTEKAMDEATKDACSTHEMGQRSPSIVGYSV